MPITKSGKNWSSLETAIQQDDVAKVREIAKRLDLSKHKKYRNACLAAARAGAGNSLEALLEAGKGFRFYSGWTRDNYARKMIEEALASPNPEPVLSIIYAANKKEFQGNMEVPGNGIYEGAFILKDAPKDVIQGCLEKEPAYFEYFVEAAGLNPTQSSTEKLKIILAFTAAAAPKSQRVLNDALITVAAMGDVEKTKLLLQHVTPELCSDVLTRLQQRPGKIDDSIIAAIETAAQPTTALNHKTRPGKPPNRLNVTLA